MPQSQLAPDQRAHDVSRGGSERQGVVGPHVDEVPSANAPRPCDRDLGDEPRVREVREQVRRAGDRHGGQRAALADERVVGEAGLDVKVPVQRRGEVRMTEHLDVVSHPMRPADCKDRDGV